ncbi:hypothetical protein OAR97_08010 [Arcobacteraceae bacterium]|nr:hypothetical protein [Arcobacteraceae bacterium]
MKKLLLSLLLLSYIYASSAEKQYWDEVKNSSDIELLKSYKKQYPHGTFEKIADIKIKRLQRNNISYTKESPDSWIKGTTKYQFYGIGKANKHFKEKHYQENLARSRAKKNIMRLFHMKNISDKTITEYLGLLETKQYIDKKERVYILLYLDNYNLID